MLKATSPLSLRGSSSLSFRGTQLDSQLPCKQPITCARRQSFTTMAAVAQAEPQVGQKLKSNAGGLLPREKEFTLKAVAGKKRYEIAPGQKLEFATASVQAFARFGSAAFVSPKVESFKRRPAKPIELYEFQGCPFCRKVREATTILDIPVLFYPCPKDGPTWRPKAIAETGKSQFPYMVDPNTQVSMLESDNIIKYLWNEYGDGQVPTQFKLGPVTSITAGLAMLPRIAKGNQYRKSRLPKMPVAIWGYEASPFVTLVREVLVELELPHLYIPCARNSPRRQGLIDKWGVSQYPYLEDPNTGVCMFETKPMMQYLNDTYAV